MVKLNKIYTRTGDDGTTGLVDGSRRAKHSPRIDAIGAVDTANSALGFAAAVLSTSPHASSITRIQNDLFDLGADIATPAKGEGGDREERGEGEEGASDAFAPSDMVLRIVPSQAEWLEQAIDAANAALEPLSSFILPGGCEASARLHLARAAVRDAERSITALASEERINPAALAYINRLSDYVFVLTRVLNDNGANDIKWVPGANRV